MPTQRLAGPLAALLALLFAPVLSAQDLRVGVPDRPPYAIAGGEGVWYGLAVDFWRSWAEAEGIDYRLVPVGRAEAALAAGEADLVLAVYATPALADAAALSQPLDIAPLAVAQSARSRIWPVVTGLLSWDFLRIVAGLSLLLLLVGAVVWRLERRRNSDQFSEGTVRGLGDGFWWAGVTLTTIGYGDKAPRTLGGRAVAMLWMLTGLAVSAALTAAVVDLAGRGGQGGALDALDGRTVAVSEDGLAGEFLRASGVAVVVHPGLAEAVAAFEEGRADAVAGPRPVLSAHLSDGAAQVREFGRSPHRLVIAAGPGAAELIPAIDRALLDRLVRPSWWEQRERYLSKDGGGG